MKTPKVGLGYGPFKRTIMRNQAQEEKRHKTGLPVNTRGLWSVSLRAKKMCREEETRLSLEFYMPYVGLGTHRMYYERGPPSGGYGIMSGPALTLRGSR